MKVAITFEVSELDRRAIAWRQGDAYPASYADVKTHLRVCVTADLETLVDDYLKDHPDSETTEGKNL